MDVKTLVYFDLEATGLKSSGKPRITELSLVAVNIQDVLDLHVKIVDLLENRSEPDRRMFQVESLLPRVLNKLTLCVYPMATILPGVSSITGLDNYNLTGQSRFDKNTVDMLNSFLARLPPPVCLVAHNGDLYDFPLLKAELNKMGGKLSSQVLCVDSYVGIKQIFKGRGEDKLEREIVEKEVEAVIELLDAGEFETEMEMGRSDNNTRTTQVLSQSRVSKYSVPTQRAKRRPSLPLTNSPAVFKMSKISKHENESTPTKTDSVLRSKERDTGKMKQVSCSAMFKSRKKLNFSNPRSDIPSSFSLINLHTHLLGRPPAQSHGAEADCLALLRVTSMLGREWLDWVEDNCYMFNDCKEMWGM